MERLGANPPYSHPQQQFLPPVKEKQNIRKTKGPQSTTTSLQKVPKALRAVSADGSAPLLAPHSTNWEKRRFQSSGQSPRKLPASPPLPWSSSHRPYKALYPSSESAQGAHSIQVPPLPHTERKCSKQTASLKAASLLLELAAYPQQDPPCIPPLSFRLHRSALMTLLGDVTITVPPSSLKALTLTFLPSA